MMTPNDSNRYSFQKITVHTCTNKRILNDFCSIENATLKCKLKSKSEQHVFCTHILLNFNVASFIGDCRSARLYGCGLQVLVYPTCMRLWQWYLQASRDVLSARYNVDVMENLLEWQLGKSFPTGSIGQPVYRQDGEILGHGVHWQWQLVGLKDNLTVLILESITLHSLTPSPPHPDLSPTWG